MNFPVIKTLVVKDFKLYFRNKFFAFITVLGMIAYIALYFLMPNDVDDTIRAALYAPEMPALLAEVMEADGLVLDIFESEDALKEALLGGEYMVGFALPQGLLADLASGARPKMTVYFTGELPEEFRGLYERFMEEIAFAAVGQSLLLDVSEVMLGQDLGGMPIAPRDRLRPLLAVFILMVETFGLAALISTEVAAGTLLALLITPMSVKDLFTAKLITGVGLAFTQAVLLLAILGGLKHEPVLLIAGLFLGALMATGIAFLIASGARDLMGVMGWGVLAMMTLSIPAFGVVFPGMATSWVKIVPSYYLVDLVHQVTNLGAGWGSMLGNLLVLLGVDIVIIALGIYAIRRKLA